MSVAFSFDPGAHEYRVDNRVVPACTWMLATGGLVPFGRINQDVLERRSELGREVHLACHLHNIGKLGSYDKRVKPYLHSWILFKEKMNFAPELSEFQTVATLNAMSYGMQIDSAGLLAGQDTIIDLKIGEIYPHHGIQLAGYAAGLPHKRWTAPLARFMARKRIALQLRESGLPKVTEFSEKSDFYVFTSLLYVSTWKKQFDSTYQEKT
jgi:hypothetical protein